MRVAGSDGVLKEGDGITIDGFTGEVCPGQVATKPSEVVRGADRQDARSRSSRRSYRALREADGVGRPVRKLGVRTNADLPDQAPQAIAFGAEGIGLCRTEHMFFGEGKIGPMREMILAETVEERRAALAKLLPLQRADFEGIFRRMKGLPVTIRTARSAAARVPAARRRGAGRAGGADRTSRPRRVRERVKALHEFNPMLGFRGCRLGIVYPEITEMQARAIFEAAATCRRRGARSAGDDDPARRPREGATRSRPRSSAAWPRTVLTERGVRFPYLVGTMIEVPRGALVADADRARRRSSSASAPTT